MTIGLSSNRGSSNSVNMAEVEEEEEEEEGEEWEGEGLEERWNKGDFKTKEPPCNMALISLSSQHVCCCHGSKTFQNQSSRTGYCSIDDIDSSWNPVE